MIAGDVDALGAADPDGIFRVLDVVAPTRPSGAPSRATPGPVGVQEGEATP